MSFNQNKPRAKEIKIIVVGSSGSGKTAFCQRWIKDEFSTEYKATVMTDFSHKIYKFEGNCYKIQVWDLAGQDKNIHTTKVLTKGSHGCLILCDITKDKGLNEVIKWKKAVEETKFIDNAEIPCLLIHNKCDLLKQQELPNESEMKQFANENLFLDYYQTSVKEGINVNESMDYLLEHIIKRLIKYSKDNNIGLTEERKSIVVQNPKEQEALMKIEEKSGCC